MSTQAIRNEITRLENDLAVKRRALEATVQNCAHRWSEVEADHIYQEGYVIPGDPPGTMGIDWRGPFCVAPKTTERWKRTCLVCGKVEHTTQTTATTIHTPKF
jgi:hypothetical protein